MTLQRTRRTDIDRAKGLAIILVVFGHIVARQDPAQVHWYQPLRRAIYGFHMPFFFYLSGLVAWLAGHARTPPLAWPRLAVVRARRLLVPFALMGALIVLGKLLAARFMMVDNAPRGVRAGLTDLVWHPSHSPAYSLWYLAVLFALGLIAPILLHALRGRVVLLVAILAALGLLRLPDTLYAADIAHYAVFYAIGLAAGSLGERWTTWIDRRRGVLLSGFAAGFVAIAIGGAAWPFYARLFVLGIIAIPALHALVRLPALSSDRILPVIGRYSLMIYLFNTIFIGLAKGILFHVTTWNGEHFIGFAVVLMAAGLLGPIALKRSFRAMPMLDRMTE